MWGLLLSSPLLQKQRSRGQSGIYMLVGWRMGRLGVGIGEVRGEMGILGVEMVSFRCGDG